MNTLKSITVTVNEGAQDSTFDVDIDTNCALFWNKDGWQMLEDYYVKVKPDPEKAKQVRDYACPKAKSKDAMATASITWIFSTRVSPGRAASRVSPWMNCMAI